MLSALMLIGAESCGEKEKNEPSVTDLANMFSAPPLCYGPYVWWHWMGSNFSKEGIRRDLEAMKYRINILWTSKKVTYEVYAQHRFTEATKPTERKAGIIRPVVMLYWRYWPKQVTTGFVSTSTR